MIIVEMAYNYWSLNAGLEVSVAFVGIGTWLGGSKLSSAISSRDFVTVIWLYGSNEVPNCGVFDSQAVDSIRKLFELLRMACMKNSATYISNGRATIQSALV